MAFKMNAGKNPTARTGAGVPSALLQESQSGNQFNHPGFGAALDKKRNSKQRYEGMGAFERARTIASDAYIGAGWGGTSTHRGTGRNPAAYIGAGVSSLVTSAKNKISSMFDN
jgi:hypothetical protein